MGITGTGTLSREEEYVVRFVGGDSARVDKGMSLCIGGDEVGDPLDVIQAKDPGSVAPATRLKFDEHTLWAKA